MKRLIFDLDNTLIKWKKDYIIDIKKTCEKYNLKIDSVQIIYDILDETGEKYKKLSKETLLKEINKKCNTNLSMEFINTLFKGQYNSVEQDEEVKEILEYLSKKYNLVVLTNYFKEIQENRLINAGIRDYFEEVYGGDEVYLKPHKEAFEKAIGDYDIKDCIMIGDDPICDIKGAQDIGLKVIAVDYYNKLKDTDEYKIIREFKELKEIL